MDLLDPKQTKLKTLNKISFKVAQSAVVAIYGPECSGSTAIGEILCKLQTDYSGNVLIGGESLRHLDSEWVSKEILYLSQSSIIEGLTVLEFLKGCDPNLTEEQAKFAFNRLGHTRLSESLHCYISPKMKSTDKIKLILCRVFLQSPKIVFLDKIFLGLNSELTEQVYTKIV